MKNQCFPQWIEKFDIILNEIKEEKALPSPGRANETRIEE